MRHSVFGNLHGEPDRDRAIANYRELAAGYDASCRRIEALRVRAIRTLALRPGETVFDIACGTGTMLPILAQGVGPNGRVIGVELTPEMAEQARQRACNRPGATTVRVDCCAIEDFTPTERADAMLFSYTQDVLQSPAALDRLIAASKPDVRIVLLGLKTLPWRWGWPINAFNLLRARRYLTTFKNLDRPWRLLESRGARVQVVHTALCGTAYIAVATLRR